jgi:penicillin-binding protein 1C
LRPDRHPDRALVRRNTVLHRMRACGMIPAAEWATALREPVRCRPGGRSFEAPHFCDLLARRLPGGGEWRSTLDSRIQAIAEDSLRTHAARWRKRQVWGGAVVVLETASGAVRALVGSPDYGDIQHAGQVNGAASLRSPGSALKPFLYAAAFDRGTAVPDTTVPDVPLTFGDYRPVNFDGQWRGMVTCRQALDQSLNIPAMWLCRKIGIPAFLEQLEKAGLDVREDGAAPPGLGVVIGDCRVRLLDLANAYAALARLGLWKPLRMIETAPGGQGRKIASPEACFLVADSLSQDSRQMAFFGNCGEVVLPKVAWKTGTSSGFRDAWCVAWNPDYVVAVWAGNPDDRGVQGLTGQAAAVPVAAELFRRLVTSGTGPWFTAPTGLVCRAVCASSGQPPGQLCPVTVTGWAIAGVSDPAFCTVHRRMPFSRQTGKSLPLEDASMAGVDWRVVEVWPGEVQDWMRRSRGAGGMPAGARAEGALRIREPVAGMTYRRVGGVSGTAEGGLTLRVTADGEAGEVYWFVNGTFFKSAPANRDVLLPWPAAGSLTVGCTDARGVSDEIVVAVE